MRLTLLSGLALLAGCRAPAPCVANDECASLVCLNGGCVPIVEPEVESVDMDAAVGMDAAVDMRLAGDMGGPDGMDDVRPRDAGMDAAADATVDATADAMVRDAESGVDVPDMACEPPELLLDVEQLAPIARGETFDFEIRTSPDTEIRIDVPYGAIQRTNETYSWAPRGGSPGDLPWPWWSGPVELEVIATLGGCETRDRFEVRVIGDVIIHDDVTGTLWVLGSDGQLLGQWVRVPGNGVTGLAIGSGSGRDLIAGVRQVDAGGRYQLHRLDEDGAISSTFDVDEFETGTALLANPARFIAVLGNGQVAAAGGGETHLPFWNSEGRFTQRHGLGGTLAVLVRWDGKATYGVNERPELVSFSGIERVFRLGNTGIVPNAVYERREDRNLVLVNGPDWNILSTYIDGEFANLAPPPQGSDVRALTRFRDGYLTYDRLNRQLRRYNNRLQAVVDPRFELQIPAISVGGLLWLDQGNWPR